MSNIAIYGAGSMGTVLGAFLSRAGTAVDLITRDEAHREALAAGGARIGGTVSFSTPPFDGQNGRGRALPPEGIEQKYDIIFLLTKQIDNAVTAPVLGQYLTPGGVVCTMQNGIPEPALADALGTDRVLGCICIWGAEKTSPGVAALTSTADSMRFRLGCLGSASHHMLNNVQIILSKICPSVVEQNFIGARWSKLLINAAFSGISAVTGCSFGDIAADRRLANYALHIIKECIEVCRAGGINIEPVQDKFPAHFMYFNNPIKQFLLSIILPAAMKNHRAVTSGMLKDLGRGRPCEIEAINGEVCRAGKEHNVPTPCNGRIVDLVHSIERGERPCQPQNL